MSNIRHALRGRQDTPTRLRRDIVEGYRDRDMDWWKVLEDEEEVEY